MQNEVITILMAVFAFNMVWSVYTTFSKEKIMIEQGEGALPASTYSFLVLRNAFRMGLYYVAFNYIAWSTIVDSSFLKLFFGVMLLAMIVEVLSAILETLARFVYFKIVFSRK